MAESATARVTGVVLKTEHRSGTSRATGNDYSMQIVRVLVGDAGIAELVLSRDFHKAPARGDLVDYLVEFSGRQNGALGATAVEAWPDVAV